MSELKTIILDGVKYVEVREEKKLRFKAGDLARVIKSENGNEGELTRITAIYQKNGWDYRNELLKGDNLPSYKMRVVNDEQLEPYTPQAGDVLTVDGVEYRLVERKAEVGEKVIVVKWENHSTCATEEFSIGDILDVRYSNEYADVFRSNIHASLSIDEYLVLERTADEKSKPITINANFTINNYDSIDEVVRKISDELKKASRNGAVR